MTVNLLGPHEDGRIEIAGYTYPARRYPDGTVTYERLDHMWATVSQPATLDTFEPEAVAS